MLIVISMKYIQNMYLHMLIAELSGSKESFLQRYVIGVENPKTEEIEISKVILLTGKSCKTTHNIIPLI